MNTGTTRGQGRGRAYKCNTCGKIDRKGRMEGHILKSHVPDERVPYMCTLCNFRCHDSQTLMSHITQYTRHQEAEMKCNKPIDYVVTLKRSLNPEPVGEKHMTMLSKEESAQWFSGRPITSDSAFDDEEETIICNGMVLPKWLESRSMQAASPLQQQPPRTVMSHVQTATQSAAGLTALLEESTGNAFHPSPVVVKVPVNSTLSQFRTPCLDELELEDHSFLQDLMRVDPNDPLLMSKEPVNRTALTPMLVHSAACTSQPGQPGPSHLGQPASSQPGQPGPSHLGQPAPSQPGQPGPSQPGHTKDDQEPPTKKARVDGCQLIADAIDRSTKQLVDALDCNTRAVRQQGKTLSDVVGELKRMERKMASKLEKENMPTLKSVVNVPRRK